MITLGTSVSINEDYDRLLHSVLLEAKSSSGEPTRQEGSKVYRSSSLPLQRMIISSGDFPFCMSRKINLRIAWEEMLFFLHGKTQTKELQDRGISFWIGNTSREFLDNRNLSHLEEGDMGKAYGYQWRHPEYDQLAILIFDLKNSLRDRNSNRRMMINLWNHAELSEMALPPCWYALQVTINYENPTPRINFTLHNRSLDIPFGFWYAVAQYRMFQMVLCSALKVDIGYMDIRMVDQHIYESQLEWAEELSKREPAQISKHNQNTISIDVSDSRHSVMDTLLNTSFQDFNIDYRFYNGTPFKALRPVMEA